MYSYTINDFVYQSPKNCSGKITCFTPAEDRGGMAATPWARTHDVWPM